MMRAVLLLAAMFVPLSVALADSYGDATDLFKNAGASSSFFGNCYGYAIFPAVGKGGLVVGGAHGSGRVYYQDGTYVGDTTVTQVSVGLQIGGQSFSQIIFFEDKRAFDEFIQGNYEFGAGVSAVAITSGATGTTGTTGSSASASGGKKDASTKGNYYKGVAVFMIVKGGAMAEASVAGQKFTYKARTATK